jgi:hypothetical protein
LSTHIAAQVNDFDPADYIEGKQRQARSTRYSAITRLRRPASRSPTLVCPNRATSSRGPAGGRSASATALAAWDSAMSSTAAYMEKGRAACHPSSL